MQHDKWDLTLIGSFVTVAVCIKLGFPGTRFNYLQQLSNKPWINKIKRDSKVNMLSIPNHRFQYPKQINVLDHIQGLFSKISNSCMSQLVKKGLYVSPHYLNREDKALKKKSERIRQLRKSIEQALDLKRPSPLPSRVRQLR